MLTWNRSGLGFGGINVNAWIYKDLALMYKMNTWSNWKVCINFGWDAIVANNMQTTCRTITYEALAYKSVIIKCDDISAATTLKVIIILGIIRVLLNSPPVRIICRRKGCPKKVAANRNGMSCNIYFGGKLHTGFDWV